MYDSSKLPGLDIETLMRRAIALAQSARDKGNHPFGALLCDLQGTIMVEAENTVATQNDVTCHAERNLISAAWGKFSKPDLARMVLVTSTEPCAMCAAATFWAGVRHVVFGLPEAAVCRMCTSEANPTPSVLNLPCEVVFAACKGHPTLVMGPVLEDEARVPHAGFW